MATDEDGAPIVMQATGISIPMTNAPVIAPSLVQAAWTSNVCSITLSRPGSFTAPANGATQLAQISVSPIAVLDLSPQTAKDLMQMLQDGIAAYEKEWGPIQTDYLRRRQTPK